MPALLALVGACDSRAGDHREHLYIWAAGGAPGEHDALVTVVGDHTAEDYGRVEAVTPVPGARNAPHHLEQLGALNGSLFAAGMGGTAYLFALGDGHHPVLVRVLQTPPGLAQPHSILRLRSGSVLVTYQASSDRRTTPGGVGQFSNRGLFQRARQLPAEPLPSDRFRPYSLAEASVLDRFVVTGADMMGGDSSRGVQAWSSHALTPTWSRLLPAGPRGDENRAPAEARTMSDGRTILVSTFRCGLYRLRAIETTRPLIEHIYTFSGRECGVGTLAGNIWVQTVTDRGTVEAVAVDPLGVATSRGSLSLEKGDRPHWVSAASSNQRLIVTGFGGLQGRVLMLTLDPRSGRLQLDSTLRTRGSASIGLDLRHVEWPAGMRGSSYPHGAVLSDARAP